uniref:Acetolactate synthase n=1 Tax=Micromonas pusilla TaxID=38833 RepID=A0A7S0I7W9_MICPS|mmetsp:Transcript_11240/g.46924  ORF Transcript_11240/g.46924 Transcript_11240/m.46924 type:complete len:603 (+) Transcript_11240:70-1878(+)
MSEVKGSDLVAHFLKAKGIEIAFGIIGSANSHIFDSINELGFTRVITTHHEQSAVLAAGAVFRASGKLSVALVTAGAGASNAVTGVVSNWADSIPCLIIAGQEGTQHLRSDCGRRMFGTQGYDSAKMVSDVSKYSKTIMNVSAIQDELEIAYQLCLTPRYGPVWLDIPFDVQSSRTEQRDWNHVEIPTQNVALNSVKAILAAIEKSERPLILGGHGVRLSGAQKEFKKFVEQTNVPVTLSWSAVDLFDSSDDRFVGRWGLYGQRAANLIVQSADLIVVFGSRLAIPQVGYDFRQFARGAKLIVVDVEECKHEVHLQILGDCKYVLKTLLDLDVRAWIDKSSWWAHCLYLTNFYPLVSKEHTDDGFVNSYKFIEKLSRLLDDDHILVTDMGTALLSGHQAIQLKSNQMMFTSNGLGEMGYGLPGALGAAFACPNRNVLCLNNDGGIMMNLQELHTIVEHDLKVKVVIFNNDGYLMIKHTQQMLFKGRYVQVDKNTGVGLPDFSKLMPAFGYKYFELREWGDEGEEGKGVEVISAFLAHPSRCVLEVFMHPEQSFIPKVKGISQADGTITPAPIEDMSPFINLDELQKHLLVQPTKTSLNGKRD